MHITWTQKAWHKKDKRSEEKVCWRWEGKRADGRSFVVLHIPHIGYIASTFNGTKLGEGKSLAQAQALCTAAIIAKVPAQAKAA